MSNRVGWLGVGFFFGGGSCTEICATNESECVLMGRSMDIFFFGKI